MFDFSDELCPLAVCDGCVCACVDSNMKNDLLNLFVTRNVVKPMNKVIYCETRNGNLLMTAITKQNICFDMSSH